MKDTIIILHWGSSGIAYDVLSKTRKRKIKWYYDTNCWHVQKFLKQHPEYKFLGSEDLCHFEDVNLYNLQDLMKLAVRTKAEIIVSKHD